MNWQTLVALLVVAAIVAAIVLSHFLRRKKVKSTCGCSCANCAMKGSCHR